MKSKIDFVNGSTLPCLFRMAAPLLLSMVLMMMYNLVDSLWVGNLLGESGYAALTSSTAVVLILNGIAMGAGNGVSIVVSQAVGAGKGQAVESIVATTLAASGLFALALTAALELGLNPLLAALQTPAEIFAPAATYLRVVLLGYLPLFLYMQFTAVFRSFGDPLMQMKGMLLTTLFNAVLDPVCIHFAGLAGAAGATVLSECLCLLYAALYARRKKLFAVRLGAAQAAWVKPLLRSAVPAAVQSCIPAISSAAMVTLVGAWGVTTLAAYGVTNKLECLLFYPAMAMNMALTAIVGQCAGANRRDRVRAYTKAACLWGGVGIGVLSALVIVFAGPLAGLFVKGAQVAAIVRQFFAIVSVGYVLYMLTSCFLGQLSGLGQPGASMLLMFVYYLVVRVPLAWVLSRTALGLAGLWAAILVSHIVAAALAAVQSHRALQRLGAAG